MLCFTVVPQISLHFNAVMQSTQFVLKTEVLKTVPETHTPFETTFIVCY